MEPRSNGRCSGLHRHKSSVGFVDRFCHFVSVPKILKHRGNELDLAGNQKLDNIRAKSVPVLVQESVHVVPDLSGVMFQTELGAGHPETNKHFEF